MATHTIWKDCPFCGKKNATEVDTMAYIEWRQGTLLIQDAFPDLSANERELIKTGICDGCWPSDDEE